ncbi:hypothetical protein CcaCcLH18_12779 [Colletotrichum camelliae]|nr:hypothetical protein CcaCcLH18_12779 [Colletotrichum camelliae]
METLGRVREEELSGPKKRPPSFRTTTPDRDEKPPAERITIRHSSILYNPLDVVALATAQPVTPPTPLPPSKNPSELVRPPHTGEGRNVTAGTRERVGQGFQRPSGNGLEDAYSIFLSSPAAHRYVDAGFWVWVCDPQMFPNSAIGRGAVSLAVATHHHHLH